MEAMVDAGILVAPTPSDLATTLVKAAEAKGVALR
jgi:hypothetical protein